MATAFGTPQPAANPNNDILVPNSPSDGISSLHFSPRANFLLCTSWDNQARCYDVQQTGQALPKASVALDAPPMCSAWSADGSHAFIGGCDKMAKRWDLATNQCTQVAAHDAPVRQLAWCQQLNMLITGSWDKTLRYWDTRSPSAAFSYQLPERLYAMSCNFPLLVCATAERHIEIFNLQNPQQVYKKLLSPLKYQTRCVTAFPDQSGFLVGSIEGRVAVQHVEDAQATKNFTFKCHRDGSDIYAVNACLFHPTQGTFVTTGADGCYNFWDKDSKQRLKAMARCAAPIPCGAFNADGSIFAYAVSYDWSKGAEAHQPASAQNSIYLHATAEAEVKARPKQAGVKTGR